KECASEFTESSMVTRGLGLFGSCGDGPLTRPVERSRQLSPQESQTYSVDARLALPRPGHKTRCQQSWNQFRRFQKVVIARRIQSQIPNPLGVHHYILEVPQVNVRQVIS